MDKYEKEIMEVTSKVKKDFMRQWEKKHHGKGYFNWTDEENDIIAMTIREMWSRGHS